MLYQSHTCSILRFLYLFLSFCFSFLFLLYSLRRDRRHSLVDFFIFLSPPLLIDPTHTLKYLQGLPEETPAVEAFQKLTSRSQDHFFLELKWARLQLFETLSFSSHFLFCSVIESCIAFSSDLVSDILHLKVPLS